MSATWKFLLAAALRSRRCLLFSVHEVQCVTVWSKAHSSRAGRHYHPPRGTVGGNPAAKQLTCYNLHVGFCFCRGSFCKTRPFPHCSESAVVLRDREMKQEANIIFSLTCISSLNNQLFCKISSRHCGLIQLHFQHILKDIFNSIQNFNVLFCIKSEHRTRV